MKPVLDIGAARAVATGLRRPECVLCLGDGGLLVSHMGAGVLHVAPDGSQSTIGRTSEVDGQPFIPNGLALLPDGDILVANMGQAGGVWRLSADGAMAAELREVEGTVLAATNFVLAQGARTWITVSTRQWPVSRAFLPDCADGFIVLRDERGARIVADGLAFANEARLDAQGRYLYVAETFAHRVSRFAVRADGLGERETFADLGSGHYPDGIAFDAEGGLWVASIISNRVLRLDRGGAPTLMLDDGDPQQLQRIEQRLKAGTLSREDVQSQRGTRLANLSSIAFGGPDLKTAYLGSLGGDTLLAFPSPVRGLAPPHWQQAFPHRGPS
jgi:sugar lactone lactonase YvrE